MFTGFIVHAFLVKSGLIITWAPLACQSGVRPRSGARSVAARTEQPFVQVRGHLGRRRVGTSLHGPARRPRSATLAAVARGPLSRRDLPGAARDAPVPSLRDTMKPSAASLHPGVAAGAVETSGLTVE